MGKKGGSAPPPPDYTPIANAQAEAAREANALAKQQFEWAQKAYEENKGITDLVVQQYLETSAENARAAAADRKRYEEIYQPLEDALVKEANEFSTPERRQLEMGRAQAEVAQQFDAARDNATRELESFGINPGSTRYSALDLGMRAQQAAAMAGAGNQAGAYVDAQGRALRDAAINVGRGYPAQIAGAYGTSNQSGSGAVNSGLATTGSGSASMGTPTQWAGVGTQNLGNWANTLNMGYTNALERHKADQSSSSGIGSVLGLGASLLTSAIPGSSILGRLFSEDGGTVPERAALALGPGSGAPSGATPGGAIPVGASPSRGIAVDDVPAQLTAGEFVIPKDVASWFGEKHLQKMVESSRREREGAIAKPTVGPAPANAGPPAFVSRPQARPAALPV